MTVPAPARRARRWSPGWVALAGAGVLLMVISAVVYVLWEPTGAAGCEPGGATCAALPSGSGDPTGSPVTGRPSGTPTASTTPSARPSATPTKRPGATLPPGRTGRCPSLSACGFPDASNTGPTITSFTRKSGDLTIRTSGQVIKGWDLQGSLDIYANNVTVTQCKIRSRNWWGINLRPGYTGLKVTYCDIQGVEGQGKDNGGEDYAISNMSNGTIEVGWNDISRFGDPLSMSHGSIHDNYIHDISEFVNLGGEWQHTDAIISGGASDKGLTIRHNTLLNATRVDQGGTAAIGLYADDGPVQNTLVEDNWLAGGAYALYGGGNGATGIRVVNNVFSTEYHPNCGYYGPVAAWNAGGAGNVWSGNVTSEGKPVNP